MLATVHKFEAAGLGAAPFRFIGVTENVYTTGGGSHSQPGGTCAYCGNGIRYEYRCESADGRRFTVGSECINKVSAKGDKLRTHAEIAARNLARDKKLAALAVRVAAVRAKLDANPALLTDRPHPAIEGKTARDYAEWMLDHGGADGRARICKFIEEVVS